MLKPAARRGLKVFAALALLAAVTLGLLMATLASRPIPANALRPTVERVLEDQIDGGEARVGGVEVVRFGEARALGLRLTGVALQDARGRPVLRAKVVEAGLGGDSLLRLAPAPSHLVLREFFVAVSVSKQGGYRLGYDAKGPPPVIDLAEILLSLTGKARRDRPLSFVRHVELDEGVLLLRQVGGPVGWTARIDRVAFDKDARNFSADTRLAIDDGRGRAVVNGQAKGEVGLHALTTSGSVSGLVPARIFPAVGFTRPLSVLDAPVQGRAKVEYAADKGVTAAEVRGGAGAGSLRVGPVVQPLQGAQLVTHYDAAQGQVVLDAFRLEAERTRLNVAGRLWLVPETDDDPARVEYRLTSADSLIAAAPTAQPQRIQGLTLNGSITPEIGRFEVSNLRVRVEGAPVRGKGLVWRGRNPDASPGVRVSLDVGGPMSIQSIYAFWPEEVAGAARSWMVPRLHSATVLSSSVRADIPPGQLDRKRLENRMLRVAFRYVDGGVKVSPALPGVEDAVGEGVVQGNRLDLTMATGRLAELAISEATVTVPRFEKGAVAVVRSRARGDLGDMLRLVNTPPLSLMASSNMSPDRFSGPADLVIEIKRPLRAHVPRADHEVSFEGQLTNLRIKDVTLGEDLTRGEMFTHGTLDYVAAEGPAHMGPFFGDIDFRMPLSGEERGRKYIDLDGKVSLAGVEGAPFRGSLTTRNGVGGGDFRSGLFDGRADWRKGDRMLAVGVGRPEAWRKAGIPAGPGFPERVPLRLDMTSKGGVWSGEMQADAFSGTLSFVREERTVRYAAEITPAEADRIGLGELPMFDRAQRLQATVRLKETSGAIDYALGGLDGRIEWIEGRGIRPLAYRLLTTLDRSDFAGLGLPLRPPAPVRLVAQGDAEGGGVSGQANLAGADLNYDVSPEREGRRQIAFSGSAGEGTFERFGLDLGEVMEGGFDFSGRLTRTEAGAMSGRLSGDFERAALTIPHSEWSKPAGARARGHIDLAIAPDGAVRLQRVVADGAGIEVRGSGETTAAGVLLVNLAVAKLEGFFDGSVQARHDPAGLTARVVARYLDFRPILKAAQEVADGGTGGEGDEEPPLMRLHADIARVRVTDSGHVSNVSLDGSWGPVARRRASLTATTERGAAIELRAYPDEGTTAMWLHVADLGEIASSLGGYDNLRGGDTTGTGRIVPGGYEFDFDIRDMTILRVPGAAQLVATDGAIYFERLEAPLSIRGAEVTLGDVVATGPSVGLTARGIMNTRTRTMDVIGVVTPAYTLNAPIGGLFGAPEGEGLFGVTYRATGAFTDPDIEINPLSAIAPGFLRRLFERSTPEHPTP